MYSPTRRNTVSEDRRDRENEVFEDEGSACSTDKAWGTKGHFAKLSDHDLLRVSKRKNPNLLLDWGFKKWRRPTLPPSKGQYHQR